MTYYRRRTPEWWEEMAAAAAGVAAGLAAFWVARTLLRREALAGSRSGGEQRETPPVDRPGGDAVAEPSG